MDEVECVVASGDLVASAIGGDASAFALLLDPLWDPAYRLAFSMLGNREAAEDAVQDAALKAWRNVRRLRPETPNLRPWFLTIVANQCRSMKRTSWWRVLPLSDPGRWLGGGVDMNADERLDLEAALQRLSNEQRLTLALRYYLDLPMDEVASVLGVSRSAAKSRVRRALKALEPALTAPGES